MNRVRVLGLSLVLLISAVPALDSGASRGQIEQPALQHEVSVTLKLIQVFVTDKQGRPITDLEKTDFEVYDNGVLKTVTDFEKHVLPATIGTSVRAEHAVSQTPGPAPGGQVSKLNRKFFFVLDIEKNDLQGFAQSKIAALHFMDTQVQPTDEISVLSYQAKRGLVIHEYMSTDHAKARKAIESIMGVPGTGGGEPATEPGEVGGTGVLAQLAPPINPEADELGTMRSNFVAVMTDLAKTLRYVPGFKNVILFSAGFSRSALLADMILRKDYEDMGKEFSSASSPIYTVNALGTRANILSPDDRGTSSLKDLSALSGGRYFGDVAQEEKISAGLQSATGDYYVLGYAIDEKWDGKFHEIRVRVNREGCVVSTQNGYYSPKPFSKYSGFEKQLQLMDLGLNENPQFQSPTELPLTALACQDQSGPSLVLLTELPPESLKDTEAVTLVFDQDNNVINDKGGTLEVPDIPKKRVIYYDIVPLKPAAYRCVVVLRNMRTGNAARARGAAIIPQPQASGLQLDSPLLLIQTADEDALYLRSTKRGQGASAKPPISLKEFFPFLTDRLVPVRGGLAKGTSRIFAIVRSTAKNIPAADIRVSASVKPGTGGEDIPLSPTILKTSHIGNTDILFLELPFPELAAGDYTLVLIAKDENSGARAEASRVIRFY